VNDNMSRESYRAIERAKKIASMSMADQRAYLESEKRREPESDSADSRAAACSASVVNLGYAKSNDAHCLACGFQMLGGANVGLCPKCGSNRWYKTRLTPNEKS
jgi:rubrerythrin